MLQPNCISRLLLMVEEILPKVALPSVVERALNCGVAVEQERNLPNVGEHEAEALIEVEAGSLGAVVAILRNAAPCPAASFTL